MKLFLILRDRAVVACWAHYPEVVGSSPTPATKALTNIGSQLRGSPLSAKSGYWRNGRRAGLRNQYRKVCRFESCVAHQQILKDMDTVFNNRRDSVIRSLQDNQSEIALLNADIDNKIAAHKAEIAMLKLQKKELKQTKVRHGWLLSMLIRWLK